MQFLRYATAFCFGGAMAFWIASMHVQDLVAKQQKIFEQIKALPKCQSSV